MFAQFNPCQPCCCYTLDRVLFYARSEQTQFQEYLEVVQFYRDILGGASFVNYMPINTPTTTPLAWQDLQQYSLIIIPMPVSLEPFLSATKMKAWLACGQRRLVITGEYGPTWDGTSAFVNNYMAELGAQLRMSLSLTVGITIHCNAPVNTSGGGESNVHSYHSITSPLYGNASGVVSGGLSVATFTDNFGTYHTARYQKFPTGILSEIILLGDSQYLGGQCAGLATTVYNQNFYRGVHPKFNPVKNV